jgi:DNA-binding LacI/PurR family transcriptional regulator
VDLVTTNNVSVGQLAFGYLSSLQCAQVAYLTTDPRWQFLRLRGQSFLNAAYDAGCSPMAFVVSEDQQLIGSYGQRVIAQSTLEALVEHLLRQPRPIGVFVANDATAVRVHLMLAQKQVKIGQEIHLIACDNEEMRLASLHPRPATIDIHAEEIGYRSVMLMQSRMQRPNDAPLLVQVQPSLIVAR